MKPPGAVKLHIVPIVQKDAIEYVRQHHRHHDPPRFGLFSLGIADEGGAIRGVAIVGRPKARMADNGWTAEVTRVATDGVPNGCSKLYGACWRAAQALGWRKLITYTLVEEGGGSLRGAGWKCLGEAGGGSWNREGRPRVDHHPTQLKMKWEIE